MRQRLATPFSPQVNISNSGQRQCDSKQPAFCFTAQVWFCIQSLTQSKINSTCCLQLPACLFIATQLQHGSDLAVAATQNADSHPTAPQSRQALSNHMCATQPAGLARGVRWCR